MFGSSFHAQVFWGQLGSGAQQLDIPGLEYSLSLNKLHFSLRTSRTGYVVAENRLHFTVIEEDQ